jgi:hypothetical protein
MIESIVVVVSGAAAERLSLPQSNGVYRISKDDYDNEHEHDDGKAEAKANNE